MEDNSRETLGGPAPQQFRPAGEEAPGSVWPQCVAALIASLAYVSAGCTIGWTSPSLPLLNATGYIELTATEVAWVSGLTPLGAMFSPAPTGLLTAKLGHKASFTCVAALYLGAWAILAAARSAAVLCVARFILGVASGVVFTITPTYIGEISQAHIRGALGSLAQLSATAGFLYQYVVGPWSSYVALAVASAAVPALLLAGSLFIPDSPYQLLRRGRRAEARRAFLWLRGKRDDSTGGDEFREMENEVTAMLKQEPSMKDLVANRATIRALLLSQGLMTFQQLSGINAVLFFTETILSIGVGSLDPSIATIIVGVVMLAAAAVTPLVVDRAGRRIMLLLSTSGMTLSLGILGTFFYFTNIHADTSSFGFVPVLCLVFYIIVYAAGIGPLAWAVSAELFAPIVRSKAASLTATTCWVLCFLVTFFFNSLVELFGSHVVFWTFAACCTAAGVFVYCLLPETKGRTLRQIQELLEG
ncbi:facilitated trehalose transporter Tret1-like [Bacillus rossius redtenbacheri]|uniref:facilitated trehalose transporter Tret1-like n=1 Tax=Bacillus rossius redtenbacheri TaxID=93214 RepID=UPI002FDCF464